MLAFPQKFTSTVSHWQATNRGPTSLWNHGRDDALPKDVVDYAIIGAGATGVSMAYQLTRPGSPGDGKRVVILEAKDVASGASGRNGGHIAPFAFGYMETLTTSLEEGGAGLTEQDALDVIFFTQENLDYVEELVKKEKMDVDFWRGERLEVLTSEENIKHQKVLLEQFRAAVQKGKYANFRDPVLRIIDDPEEAKKVSRIYNALRVTTSPSGSWHPHRGATALLHKALDSKTSQCSMYSWTPVSSFKQGSDEMWSIDYGERGQVKARNVFVATNAYTHHLFPDEAKANKDVGAHVIPWRLSAGLVTPPTTFSGTQSLNTTFSAENGPYLIQTPHSGLLLGPYTQTVLELLKGPDTVYETFGIEDDSIVPPPVRDWIANYCKDNFAGWGPEADGEPGEGLARVWSGILGWSVDRVPLVGQVPGRPGLWVSIGYNGMGMGSILNITRHLSKVMQTGKWEGLPACFQITKERLERARKAKPPG